jgi:hypothetical protein
MPMQIRRYLRAKQRSQPAPESFKACYVLVSQAINNEEGLIWRKKQRPRLP